MLFTDESLIVTLEDGQITEFDLDKLLHSIGIGDEEAPRVLTRRNTLGSVFNIADRARRVSLKDIVNTPNTFFGGRGLDRRHTMQMGTETRARQHAASALGFTVKRLAFNEDYLYFVKKNSLFVCELDSILKGDFTISRLSMQKCRPEDLADHQLQFLLSSTETVTDSHLVMAHSWPLYVVGTSHGRVFVVPLAVTKAIMTLEGNKKEAISAMLYYHDTLVSCSGEGTVNCWSIAMQETEEEGQSSVTCEDEDSSQRVEAAIKTPIATFRIPYSDVRVLKQPHALRDVLDHVSENFWKEKWAYWQHIIVGQVEEETVILLSMERQEVICAFYGMKGGLRDAFVHLLLDYLYVNCGDGDCYIINMQTLQLERIIPSFSISFHSPSTPSLTPPSQSLSLPQPQQTLRFTLSSLATQHSQALAWVESVTLGKAQFPVLFMNAGNIAESFNDAPEFPEQAEFIISLINNWMPLGEENNKLQTQLQLLFQIQKPAVVANIGTFGVENALSFSLPGKRSKWEVSGYITSVLSASLQSILTACTHFKPSLQSMIQTNLESHFSQLKTHLRRFKRPCPVVLGFEVLNGNPVAYDLLRSAFPLYDHDELVQMTDEWLQIFMSTPLGQGSLPRSPKGSIDHWKTTSPVKDVSPEEALSAIMLSILSLSGVKIDVEESIINTFGNMLKGGNQGYIIAASLLLFNGIKRWRGSISKDAYMELVVSELTLHHSSTRKVRHATRKALMTLGRSDIPAFCEVLKREVTMVSIDREYPETVLTVLEGFIYKHSAHLLMDLPAVMDVLLRALDPREIILRKICLSKGTDILELLIKQLPMAAFDRSRQLLALGTNTQQVLIYDVKTASIWRELQGHSGPVSAVCFSSDGNYLASYSVRDSSLRIWRIEVGFLGLGGMEINAYNTISLPNIEPVISSSRDLITTISLNWGNDQGVQLVREDGVGYCYMVN